MSDSATTILLVEDNVADARYAEELLPPPTYTFVKASSLAQALDCVEMKNVDVVLLDLSLPDSHGLETVSNLLERRRELPIVVLTGLEDISCATEAVRAGAHDYIVKGRLTGDNLARSIAEAIEAKKRQLSEEDLLKHTRLGFMAAEVSHALVEALTVQEMLQRCAETFMTHLNAVCVRIYTLSGQDTALLLQGSCGVELDSSKRSQTIPVGEPEILELTKAGSSVLIETDEAPQTEPAGGTTPAITNLACLPLAVNEKQVGALAIYTEKHLDAAASKAVHTLAEKIAIGIDKRTAEEARSLLAAIVEGSEDAIISKTLDGTISSWNKAAERMYGYSRDEMIGKNISILIPEEKSDELALILEKLKNGESIRHFESVRLRKDRSRFDVSLSISTVKNESGTIIGASASIRDISDQKRAERLAHAQNEVTRLIARAGPLIGVAHKFAELIGQTCSASFCGLWLLDRSLEVLKCAATWNGKGDQLKDFETLSRHLTLHAGNTLPGRVLLAGDLAHIAELNEDQEFIRKNAAISGKLRSATGFPIACGGKVLGIVEVFFEEPAKRDEQFEQAMLNICAQIGQCIDRAHSEAVAKQATQAQLTIAQSIIENAPIGIAWLDNNLMITRANKTFAEQFQRSHETLPGTFIFQIPTGISNERLVEVIRHGGTLSLDNFRISQDSVSGTIDRYYDLLVWPVKVNDVTDSVVMVTADVTERVRLSQQREDFVATLTHDMKNPLIGQSRMLRLLLEGNLGSLAGEQAEIMTLLKTSTDELLDLISTLLEVYRYDEGGIHLAHDELDARDLIDHCVGTFQALAKTKSIMIDWQPPEENLHLTGDEMALRRVLMNLLDNAVKFTPENGTIKITCKNHDSVHLITVQDDGPGIAAEEIQYLYQRFGQTRSGRKYKAGTGLGLYLCRQIVEAHQGNIACSSKEGVGTSFVISLPARVS